MKIKLIVMLALAILLPLGWVLSLTNASAPLVASYGVGGCVAYAVAISLISAWLIVSFVIEMREYLDRH